MSFLILNIQYVQNVYVFPLGIKILIWSGACWFLLNSVEKIDGSWFETTLHLQNFDL